MSDKTEEGSKQEVAEQGVAVPTPAKPGQIDLNIGAYERIYLKCWGSAARIALKTKQGTTDQQTAITELLFHRFFDDQIKVRVAGESARAMEPMMEQLREFVANRQFA